MKPGPPLRPDLNAFEWIQEVYLGKRRNKSVRRIKAIPAIVLDIFNPKRTIYTLNSSPNPQISQTNKLIRSLLVIIRTEEERVLESGEVK